MTHHLTFSESIDSIMKRSAISIGYVSHKPNKYFIEQGAPIIRVSKEGICESLGDSSLYIPELAWFVELMFVGSDFDDSVSPRSYLGPTGLLALFLSKNERKTAVSLPL